MSEAWSALGQSHSQLTSKFQVSSSRTQFPSSVDEHSDHLPIFAMVKHNWLNRAGDEIAERLSCFLTHDAFNFSILSFSEQSYKFDFDKESKLVRCP